MTRRLLVLSTFVGVALAGAAAHLPAQPGATAPPTRQATNDHPRDWVQWGGPDRNFTSEVKGLASSWPASGPKKLWSRSLGEGHSSIIAEGGRIYTLYRQITRAEGSATHEEVVAAFDAATGQTIWEFEYPAPTSGIDFSQGLGPHSTPLIVGNHIFATSSRSELFALDKTTGKRVWSHDMLKDTARLRPGVDTAAAPSSITVWSS